MSAASAVARRTLADSRTRTISFALLFAALAAANAVGYRKTYPTRRRPPALRPRVRRQQERPPLLRRPARPPHRRRLRVLARRRHPLDLRGRLGAARRSPRDADRGGHGPAGARARGDRRPRRRLRRAARRDRNRRRRPLARDLRRPRRVAPARGRLRVSRARGRRRRAGLRRGRRAREPAGAEPADRARARRRRAGGGLPPACRRRHVQSRRAPVGDAARLDRGAPGLRGASARGCCCFRSQPRCSCSGSRP